MLSKRHLNLFEVFFFRVTVDCFNCGLDVLNLNLFKQLAVYHVTVKQCKPLYV